jgi:hypothetical protein
LVEIGSVVSEEKIFSKFHLPFFLFLVWQPSWLEVGITGHIFGREPSNDYFIKILLLLSKWFQTRRFLWEFPIGSYLKLSSAVAAGSLPKLCPVIPTSNQDGCQTKNRKKEG